MRRTSLFRRLLASHLLIALVGLASLVAAGLPGDVRRAIGISFAVAVLLAAGLAVLAARSISRSLASAGRTVEATAAGLAARLEDLRGEAGLREQVLSSMMEGVLLSEPSGGVVYANPAARALLGDPRTLPPQIARPGVHEFELHHPRRIQVRTTTATLEDGRVLAVLQDVTEAKRVEAMRRDFVADASHEMKTPVASILATAETLEHALWEDPASATRFSATLSAEARRLARLVEDLLDLARLEKGRAASGIVGLSEVVEREAVRASTSAAEKGLALVADVAAGVEITGDENDLTLAVRNVLDNAVRYTESGEIAVRLGASGGRARLEISDTGVGIPAKDLPRIFERFYRVDKARSRDTGGTGLGLSIVRHVVESHGGEVRAASQLGSGSTFAIELPLAGTRAHVRASRS